MYGNVTSMKAKAPPILFIEVTCSQSWHCVPVGGEGETKTVTALDGSLTALIHVKY